MKKSIFILIFLFSIPLLAQNTDFAKVLMKNGTEWVGQIKAENDSILHLEIEGGSILALNRTDIVRLELGPRKRIVPKRFWHDVNVRQRGWFFGVGYHAYPGAGYYFGNLANAGVNSLSLKSTYKFRRYVQLGSRLALLFPRTGNSTLLSWRGRVESEFLNRGVSPYVYADGGYAFSFNSRANDNYSEKGGFGMGAGAGMRIYTRRLINYFLELGYWRQNLEEYFDYRPWGSIETRYYTLSRFAFSVGLEF